MSGIIKTIKAKDEHDVQHNIFPKTVLEAVVDVETGKTLDVLLDENMPEGVVYTNDESEPETNVDAVTSASYVSYSNTDSGLEATNVQDAIDKVVTSVNEKVNTADIVDNLESTSTDKPLSANQGKVLNDNKINYTDVVDNLLSTATNVPLSANQGRIINESVNAHFNSRTASCGINAITNGSQFRIRARFYGDRAVVLLLVKGNTPIDSVATLLSNNAIYYFIYDRVACSLTKLTGDCTIAVDVYSYDETNKIITVDFSGFNEWSTVDIISHMLINTETIT